MKIPKRTYPAKILLFGEYTILEGARAIAFPLRKFSGCWEHGNLPEGSEQFFAFLAKKEFLDAGKIMEFVNSGHSFKSNIPVGYGVGSSGALTAACFELFRRAKACSQEELINNLAEMEAYFHGQSSGMDPLCSYMDCCVIKSDNGILFKDELELPSSMFLFDSGKSRSTAGLVDIFKSKLSDRVFRAAVDKIKILGDDAISCLEAGDHHTFKESFVQISALQYEHFNEMILPELRTPWEKGLDTGEYALKLSGAGGGGFYLGLGTILETENISYIS